MMTLMSRLARAFVQAVSVRLILITLSWIFVRIVGYICLNIVQIAPLAKVPLPIIALNAVWQVVGSVWTNRFLLLWLLPKINKT